MISSSCNSLLKGLLVQGVTCSVNKLTLPPSLPVLECCGDKGGLQRLLCVINIYHSVPNEHNPPRSAPKSEGLCWQRGGSSFHLEISYLGSWRGVQTPPQQPETPAGGHRMGHGAGSSRDSGRWGWEWGSPRTLHTPALQNPPEAPPLQPLSPPGTHPQGADPWDPRELSHSLAVWWDGGAGSAPPAFCLMERN